MKALKRVFTTLLCSILIAGSVGSSLFRGYEVKASSVVDVVGGSALFEFLLGLFGVSVTVGDNTPSALPFYNEYLEYLRTSSTQLSYDEYEALASGNVVTISQGLVGSVQDFLEGKIGSLASGSVQEVSGSYFLSNVTVNDPKVSSFVNFISSSNDYYFIAFGITNDSYGIRATTFRSFNGLSDFFPCSSNSLFVYSFYGGFSFVTYDSSGLPVSVQPVASFSDYRYSSSWSVSQTLSANVSLNGYQYLTNCPIVITTVGSSSISTVSRDFLFETSHLEGASVSRPDVMSFGGYSKKNLDAIMGKNVSGSTISATNTAVSDAVSSNTITDAETGAISYTDEIAQAVADAVAKALSDAGVIDKPGTGEGEGEEEGEETDKPLPWVPDLLGKLDSIKDAIVGGLQDVGEWIMDIPQNLAEFFTTLWEWLQRIWEAICALPGQIADAFERFFLGDGTENEPGEGDVDPPDGTPFLADLTTLFPFCIPFDLIRLFKVMQSTAQAPYWEIPLDVPSIGLHYVFVIDFSQFETLAQIFRICETIGFCCGLILITRQLIKG